MRLGIFMASVLFVVVAAVGGWTTGVAELTSDLKCMEGAPIQEVDNFSYSLIEDDPSAVLCFVQYSKVPRSIFQVVWDHRDAVEIGMVDGRLWLKTYREVKPPGSDRWRIAVDQPISSDPIDPTSGAALSAVFTEAIRSLHKDHEGPVSVLFGVVWK